jgi:flagellar biosynthesis protein FlhG
VARDIYEKLCNVTRRFLKARLKLLGFVPRDENIHRAVLMQRPVVTTFPMSPASRALNVIADKLLTEPPPPGATGGLKFLWHRLLRDAPMPAAAL